MNEKQRGVDVLGGGSRIEGTRVGTRHAAAGVTEGGQSPTAVAYEFDVSLADTCAALSYYYEHIEAMREYERANETAFEELPERSVKPKETVN